MTETRDVGGSTVAMTPESAPDTREAVEKLTAELHDAEAWLTRMGHVARATMEALLETRDTLTAERSAREAAEAQLAQRRAQDQAQEAALDAHEDDPLAAAVEAIWGERCSDFEPGCACCRAWERLDSLTGRREAAEAEVARLKTGDRSYRAALICAAQFAGTWSSEDVVGKSANFITGYERSREDAVRLIRGLVKLEDAQAAPTLPADAPPDSQPLTTTPDTDTGPSGAPRQDHARPGRAGTVEDRG